MRSWGIIIVAFFFVVVAAGCESDKDTFSGLSDLVAERNKVRKVISQETAQKKKGEAVSQLQDDVGTQAGKKKSSEDTLSSVALYEKNIEVVDSQSGRSLAKGVAYFNKKGRIVRIRILKN